jgi:hypothetical protein
MKWDENKDSLHLGVNNLFSLSHRDWDDLNDSLCNTIRVS